MLNEIQSNGRNSGEKPDARRELPPVGRVLGACCLSAFNPWLFFNTSVEIQSMCPSGFSLGHEENDHWNLSDHQNLPDMRSSSFVGVARTAKLGDVNGHDGERDERHQDRRKRALFLDRV